MAISIMQNVVNIGASLILVFGLGMKVEGVATGTVIAQYAGLAVSLALLFKYYGRLRKHFTLDGLFKFIKMLDFFKVNSDIFLRTICLVAVNLFFLSAGARQGNLILAVNTLLVQLYIFFSYFLDGFAFAGEALCGKYFGAKNHEAYMATVKRVFLWGWIVAVTFTAVYSIGGQPFLNLLTDEEQVVKAAVAFLPWAVAVPLVGVAAFVWDGVYVGITATKGMLFSSAVATALFFALYFLLRNEWGNHALWFAFLTYMVARGVTQTAIFEKCHKKW